LPAHKGHGRARDVHDAIEVRVHHRLESLCAQLLEGRNIAEAGIVHDDVETPKRIKRHLYGGLSGAFICHVKGNSANLIAEFLYQIIEPLWVSGRGDEFISGFEHSLRNVTAEAAGAAGYQPCSIHKSLLCLFRYQIV
jgi:hypothetical protein